METAQPDFRRWEKHVRAVMSDHKMTIRAAANHLMLAFKENSKTQAEIKKCAKAMLKT